MRLEEVLAPQALIAELRARDKAGALRELVEVLPVDREQALAALWERERLGSTAIGQGVAIPHARLAGLSRPVASFGRSPEGVEFDSLDGRPVHFIFCLLAPEGAPVAHLRVLARMARILGDGSLRRRLQQAAGREELYRLLVAEDRRTGEP